ncbi:MAG: DNA polymerase III subunit gamma/tau [Clostridia bacterium]|nr:DNA polymerase III subunit gamma/tau [Clostridia bacterium]
MGYLAYYRAFRPTTFDEVVRQEHIVQILKNQIKEDKVGHAYLFCGPRGTGKTTLAKIFAKAVNCLNPKDGSPCGECAVCRALSAPSSLDISEIDAASNNGVDEMRDLRDKVQYPPVNGRYKVYIIDEVHMLSSAAFNAVLKTLEEPPAHAIFILATTEPQKIPATILSRCMRFDFKLIPREDLENLIRSVFDRTGKKYEDEAVAAIARAGAGSARDSLSIADMCASFSEGVLSYDDVNEVLGSADFGEIAGVVSSILTETARETLEGVEGILSTGKSVGVLVRDILNFLNWCAIAKMCRNAEEIVNLPGDRFEALVKIASIADGHKILRVSEIFTKAEQDLRFAVNPRITLETAALRASMPDADYDLDAILGRIAALEKKIESGAVTITRYVEGAPSSSAPGGQYVRKASPPKEEPTSEISDEILVEEGAISIAEPRDSLIEREKEEAEDVPALFDGGEEKTESAPAAPAGAVASSNLFAKFMAALRTTHKNPVVFTLCMNLGVRLEGDTLVLLADNEYVYRGLNKEGNRTFVGDVLRDLGVESFDIKMESDTTEDIEVLSRGEDDIKTLKENFGEEFEVK